MGDDITIGVTEIVNNIEVTAQPNDQIIDISVVDNSDEVTLNVTPTVIEINVNKGSSYAYWGGISGTLSDQTDLQDALDLKADLVDGKVPSYQLPSYVDDVIEVANYASLPVTGESGKIYVTIDNNHIFRWTGSVYVEITDNTAVWGAITGTLSSQTDLQSALNAKVPYTGATGNVTLGEYGLTSGYLQLDTTPTSTPTTIGTMYWDAANRTAALIDGDGDTTLQIGQEQRILVHNNTGSTLTDGQVVYVTGSTGELPSVSLADATSETTSAATIGVVTETIANGADGFITTSGIVHGLNTLAFNEGDLLWLGTTAGTFSTTKPTSPAHLVLIGYVIKKAGGNGSILVKIQNTQELSESSDVLFTSLANNDILTYESSSSLWKNKSISTILGYTPANDSNVVHKTGDETITGRKTFNSTTDIGIRSNNSGSGWGIYTENSSTGIANYIANNGSGKGFVIANALSSFGNMFEGSYNGTTNFFVNYLGGGYFASKVGIGTNAPNYGLNVVSSTLADAGIVSNQFVGVRKSNNTINGYLALLGGDNGENAKIIGYNSSGTQTFEINASSSATYFNGGNFGIGTTSPSSKIEVAGGDIKIADTYYFGWRYNSGDSNMYNRITNSYSSGIKYQSGIWTGGNVLSHDFQTSNGSSYVSRLSIMQNGNVGIGTTSPGVSLEVNGLIRSIPTYNNTTATLPNLVVSSGGTFERSVASSIRYKENVKDWNESGLDLICALKPRTFKYKKDYYDKTNIEFLGLIAEEVSEVSSYLADYENEDRTGEVANVRYANIVVPLIKAIQELKAEIDLLKQNV